MDASKRESVDFHDGIFIENDTYYYRGTPEGHRSRVEISLRIKRGARQKDVLAALKERLDKIERRGTASGKNTFADLAEDYLKDRLEEAKNPNHLSMRTYGEAEIVMRIHLIPFFKRDEIISIGQAEFVDYCQSKKKKNLNVVNHRKVLNHFMKWCLHKKFIKYPVVVEIPKFARKARRQRVVLDDDQIKKLVKAADGQILLYVLMYLFMGMRNMEIVKLRWEEVDLGRKELFINPMSNRRRRARSIPINKFVLGILINLKKSATSEWVFPSRVKAAGHWNPYGGVRNAWGKVLEKAELGVHITPHDLRSTFETYMHTNINFTDTQREHMAGARIDVQKDIYVKLKAGQIKGLEESVKVDGISQILDKKSGMTGGKRGGKMHGKTAQKSATIRKKGNIRA